MEATRPAVDNSRHLNGSSHEDSDLILPPPPAPFPTDLLDRTVPSALSEQHLSALQSTCASALASLLPIDTSNSCDNLTDSDRQLAANLTELLEITYELDEMGPSPAYEEVAGPSQTTRTTSELSQGGLEAHFTTLLRNLESLEIPQDGSTGARNGLEPAVNAARQELALLRIQTLTRVVLRQVRARKGDTRYKDEHFASDVEDGHTFTSLADHANTLPRYEHDDTTRNGHLPDYAGPKSRRSIDKTQAIVPSSAADEAATSEKMINDLDNLTAAIERLNALSSGYSDQRSVLRPRSRSPSGLTRNGEASKKGKSREDRRMTEKEKMRELEYIWRKIESAHGKHRMKDDQRADMDGVRERRAEERGRFLQELYERVEASRLKDQDGERGVVNGDLARARELRNRDRYLKELLEVSAESRYSDQDAIAPSVEQARASRQQAHQTYIHDLIERMQSGRLDSQDYPISPEDCIDSKRQDLVDSLVSFSSSGRFDDQDSVPPTPRQQEKDSGEIVTMKDFFKSDPPVAPAANGSMANGDVVGNDEKRNGTMRKIKGIMRRSSLGLGLKGTKDLDLSLVNHVVEHQENLNIVNITLYGPNLPLNTDISIQSHDPASCSLPAVEAILTKDNTSLRIPMPVPIQSDQSVPLITQGLFLEAKLSSIPIAAAGPSLISSVNHPLSAAELRDLDPSSICCISCDREITIVSRSSANQPEMKERFKDLPSEYWAEMMEVWMCHQDPGFTAKLAERTREGFWPTQGKVLVGGNYLLLHQEDLKRANIRINETKDISWDAVSCACGEKLGKMRKHDGRPGAGTLRLSKWAISIFQEDEHGDAVQLIRHPLGSYITADMLELARAHATYSFFIVDEESEEQRILIWLFNPSVRISYRRNINTSLVPPPSPLRNTHTDKSSSKSRRSSMGTASRPVSRGDSAEAATARTIRACKVMYRATDHDGPLNGTSSGQAQIEELRYPPDVVERLLVALKGSTNVYPEGRRKMGIWEVGFLERL